MVIRVWSGTWKLLISFHRRMLSLVRAVRVYIFIIFTQETQKNFQDSMMRILRYLIVVMVAMLPGMLMAAPVDAMTASEVAARFVTSGNAASLRSCHAPLRLVHTAISASKPIVAD